MTASPDADRPRAAAVDLDARYGRRSTGKRPLVVAAIVCGVAAALGFGWVAWGMLQPSVNAEVLWFEVIDETESTFLLEVTRPVGAEAVCTIEALGDGFVQVGVADLEIAPSEASVDQVPLTIATSAPATVVDVRGCRLA